MPKPPGADLTPLKEWNYPRAAKVVLAVPCAFILAALVILTVGLFTDRGLDRAQAVLGIVAALGVLAFGVRMVTHVGITATPYGLAVRNVFRTRYVPWGTLRHVVPTRNGLLLARTEGRPVFATAVTESPLEKRAQNYTRAQHVTDEILAIAQQHGAPLVTPGVQSPPATN